MNIRRAEEKDIPQIEKLLFQVHKVHSDIRPDLFIPGQKKYTTEQLADIIPDDEKPIYVAEEEDEILGYAFCIYIHSGTHSTRTMKTLYIDDLCVEERSRGKKVGKALYEYVVGIAKENGCYNLTLNVWEHNESAKKFYESCGLKIQKYGMETVL